MINPDSYTAWFTFIWLHRRVISLIRTWDKLLERNFLWIQRKLISAIEIVVELTLTSAGVAEMNATSFLLLADMTPIWSSGW